MSLLIYVLPLLLILAVFALTLLWARFRAGGKPAPPPCGPPGYPYPPGQSSYGPQTPPYASQGYGPPPGQEWPPPGEGGHGPR